MTKNPKTAMPEMTAQAAAKLMRKEDVGSLVIIEDGSANGILTEKDLVKKVVAEGLSPSKVKVRDIMSTPLITIAPTESVAGAAKMMAEMKLRRLPVVSKGKLIGILTENDVLKLSPSLIELTREWSRLGAGGAANSSSPKTSGYCENCGTYSSELMAHNSEMLCADCLEQTLSGDDGE